MNGRKKFFRLHIFAVSGLLLLAEKTRFGAGYFTTLGFVGFIAMLMIFDSGFLAFFIMFIIFIVTFPLQLILRQKMLAKAKIYTPSCRTCKKNMRLLNEKEDNRFLNPSEIAEEKVNGMDYEFWVCDACHLQQQFNVRMDGADVVENVGNIHSYMMCLF